MIKVLFSSLICSSIISLIGANACLAEDFRIYVKQQVESLRPVFTGGSFDGVGQEDLYPFQRDPIDAISRKQFINKTMWLINVRGGNWIETGAVNGWTLPTGMGATTFWKGYYYASSIDGVYRKTLVGRSGVTGRYSYGIFGGEKFGSNYKWNIYIYNNRETITKRVIHPVPAFQVMQIGIETGNSCNSFKSGTYAFDPYTRDALSSIGGSWALYPDRLPVYNVDRNNIDKV